MVAPKLVLAVMLISSCVGADTRIRDKRVIPFITNCDPRVTDNADSQKCLKGDWVDPNIADCERPSFWSNTCNPQFSRSGFWVVEPPEPLDGCQASSNKQINCDSFEDTRCVCSSNPENFANHCRCQYWPRNTVTAGSVCYGYHPQQGNDDQQWACCYNIHDMNCNTRTWQISSQSQSRCTDQDNSNVRQKHIFNCGDCGCLQACQSKCVSVILQSFTTASRDRCGAWLDCFRGCCVKAYKQEAQLQSSIKKRQTDAPSVFCGDGVCSTSSESASTCPQDCCPQANPNNCTVRKDICSLNCCQTSTCCLSTSASPATYTTYTLGILLLALYVHHSLQPI